MEHRQHRRIDYLGSLLLMVAIAALMLVLVQGGSLPRMATAAGVAVAGIVALVRLWCCTRAARRNRCCRWNSGATASSWSAVWAVPSSPR